LTELLAYFSSFSLQRKKKREKVMNSVKSTDEKNRPLVKYAGVSSYNNRT